MERSNTGSIGDDIFVVRDANGQLVRVQVKTATGIFYQNIVKAQFSIGLPQLQTPVEPLLVYAFVVRIEDHWHKLTIIRQDKLLEEYQFFEIGSRVGGKLILSFRSKENGIMCGKRDFSNYLNNF